MSHVLQVHPTGDAQAPFVTVKTRFWSFLVSAKIDRYSTSELYRLASLLYYLLAQFCAHRPHTHPQQRRRTKPLFQIASTRSSVVQGREGTYCPLRTLPHSFEEQPFLIINRHTKRWAPNNTEQIPLCAQVLNVSATTVRPPPLLLLFRYLHISERCGGHKRYSQLSFSPILWNRPILKLLFVQSLSLTPLMLPPSACHCLSTGCCKKATN